LKHGSILHNKSTLVVDLFGLGRTTGKEQKTGNKKKDGINSHSNFLLDVKALDTCLLKAIIEDKNYFGKK
jgi:hypothetical protein